MESKDINVSDIFKHTCLGYNGKDSRTESCSKFIPGGLCSLDTLFRCTEWLKEHEPTLSYSSIRLFSHCRRAFWYDWVTGLEAKEKRSPAINGVHCIGGNGASP